MVTEARRMIKASADMYNVDVTVSEAGGAPACVADHELGAEIKALAEACGQYGQVVDYMDLGGSEDLFLFYGKSTAERRTCSLPDVWY